MEQRSAFDGDTNDGPDAQSVQLPADNSSRFREVFEELVQLHDRKQSDYGRAGDPFANIRGSEEWGIPAWVGALVRATDKIKRLQKAARGSTLTNEGVKDSLDDLIVYGIIAKILWEEENEWES